LWIRRSTGRLCADPGEEPSKFFGTYYEPPELVCLISLNALGPDSESMVISSLTLQQYIYTCYYDLSQCRTLGVAQDATVNLGSLIFCSSSSQLEDSIEIAAVINPTVYNYDWAGTDGVKTVAGWTRSPSISFLIFNL
jgi:hypothetical protein